MKNASIEILTNIRPHPNADRLEIATVLGWQCIVKRGEFRPGDRVVFVAPDTILPKADWSQFLASKSNPERPIRLRTAKLRGEFSQGLVLPTSVLPEASRDWHEGADAGAELGVKKYEKEIPACLSGVARAAFPQHLAPRTDEDNWQSVPDQTAKVIAGYCTATRKLDGSSGTVIVENGVITHVCSRKLDLEESEGNAFWRVARQLTNLAGHTFVLQGELMGPGIQGNQLELSEPRLYAYQLNSPGFGWFTHADMADFCAGIGCSAVPREFEGANFTTEFLQGYADALELRPGVPAEGIVVRPVFPVSMGNGRPLGVKFINRNYKDE